MTRNALLATLSLAILSGFAALLLPAPAASAAEPAAGPPAPDPQVESIIDRLVGCYADDEHTLRIANVLSADLHRVVYVELSRNNSPLHPMWQQFWSFTASDGAVRARVCEFPRGAAYAAVYTGAWAAPDLFPRVTVEMLDVHGDLTIHESADDAAALTFRSENPMPLFRAGAVDMTMEVKLAGDSLTWTANGRAADGQPAWDDAPMTLTRAEDPAKVDARSNGLAIIDFKVGEGPSVATNDTINLNFTGRLINGFVFDSPDLPKRGKTTPIPGNFPSGWNIGVLGVQAGGVRRIVIPPHLGAGDQGLPAMQIPPNAWLIYDLEVVSVKDNTPDIDEPEVLPPPTGVPGVAGG